MLTWKLAAVQSSVTGHFVLCLCATLKTRNRLTLSGVCREAWHLWMNLKTLFLKSWQMSMQACLTFCPLWNILRQFSECLPYVKVSNLWELVWVYCLTHTGVCGNAKADIVTYLQPSSSLVVMGSISLHYWLKVNKLGANASSNDN